MSYPSPHDILKPIPTDMLLKIVEFFDESSDKEVIKAYYTELSDRDDVDRLFWAESMDCDRSPDWLLDFIADIVYIDIVDLINIQSKDLFEKLLKKDIDMDDYETAIFVLEDGDPDDPKISMIKEKVKNSK